MKYAISGKGGVGKSTIAAVLALQMSRQGKKVLAIDADPDANLASALGIPEDIQKNIVPISRQIALIEERTGAKVNQYGQIFKLNPEVSDIADKYASVHNNVALLVLGAIDQGGGGCACPENVFIRSLITDLVLYKDDALIIDMEAGIEHLGRATAKGVNSMLIVVEPGRRSIDCARKIIQMARQIGIPNIQIIANKINNKDDEQFIKTSLTDYPCLATIPYSEKIRLADRKGKAVIDELDEDLIVTFQNIVNRLKENTVK